MRLFLDSCYVVYLRYALDDRVANYVTSLLQQATERNLELVVNMIVLDEVVWVLSKKYEVPLADAFELLDRLLPLLSIVPLDSADYTSMKEKVLKYGLKPSDSLHVASMVKAEAEYIASEDNDFDRVPSVTRLWLDAGNLPDPTP